MLAEFSIVPLDKGVSLSEYVSKVIDIVDKSELDYQLTPMGTVVEGEWNKVMNLISECHKEMRKYSDRIETKIIIDDRKGANNRLTGKIESVEKRLGKEVKK
ncbi:MAG: MTH1187 family thiamine-binding protein [Candidatus Thermoplasmatota archaeon]|nr:MTH1187 family thiamine-binding protein [Candidatus Thermoplasmatota archaeon]MBS3790784.1 MTH1187 family thiamine-binding protein [Candidatus Thermoplasmatota archaeon]